MRKTKAKIMTEKRDNAIVRNEKAITLIALMITIVLNSSYLAMDRINKIEKI